MQISKSARRDARELFRSCLVNGVLDEERVRQVVRRIGKARPRGFVAVLSQFRRLVKLQLEQCTARVDSAAPLPPDIAASITQNLNRVYGRGLRISFAQDPALLGGFRIKVGSDVYNGSVQARLERLEEQFSK